LRQFQRQVVHQLRGLLLTKAGASGMEAWSEEQLAEMRDIVAGAPPQRIVAALRAFGEADLRADPLSPLPLELALASSVLAASSGDAAAAPPAEAASAGPARAEAIQPAKRRPAREPALAVDKPGPAKPPPAKKQSSNGPAEEQVAAGSAPPDKSPEGVDPALAEVRARWQDIYTRARELHYKTGALLNSGCDIIQASEGEIVFGFRHTMLLERMLADGGENLQALQQAVDDVLGPGRAVRCVQDSKVETHRPRGGHLVRAAEEMGGQVLSSDG